MLSRFISLSDNFSSFLMNVVDMSFFTTLPNLHTSKLLYCVAALSLRLVAIIHRLHSLHLHCNPLVFQLVFNTSIGFRHCNPLVFQLVLNTSTGFRHCNPLVFNWFSTLRHCHTLVFHWSSTLRFSTTHCFSLLQLVFRHLNGLLKPRTDFKCFKLN